MNTRIVRAIDTFLDANHKTETTPVEVAPYLEKKGLLKNSRQRSGKQLRVLLRNGDIPNAYQNGNKWFIRRSKFQKTLQDDTEPSTPALAKEPVSPDTIRVLNNERSSPDGFSWKWCQEHSDAILLSGLSALTNAQALSFDDRIPGDFGNYLISDKSGYWKYTGESNNLAKRLRQHSKLSTSTFYKNYTKSKANYPSFQQDLNLEDFQVQYLVHHLGRKEIEEFGIVNLPCNLNKFQTGKRDRVQGTASTDIWYRIQQQVSDLLKEGAAQLEKLDTDPWGKADVTGKAGMYWIEHPRDGLIYIGESSSVLERYQTHSAKTYFSAFRRNTAENILGFNLITKNKKKRYLTAQQETELNAYIHACSIKTMPIAFGRFELEEYLITKHRPLLNRKGNS